MANHHQPNRHSIRRAWLEAFIGTPRRFAFWLAVLLVLAFAAFPQTVGSAITYAILQVATALEPIFYGLLPIAVAVLGIWLIFRAILPQRRNRNRNRDRNHH